LVSPAAGGDAVLTLRIGLRAFTLALLQGTAEAIALGAGLDDMDAISNTVDQRLAQPGIGNHLSPFRESQTGSGLAYSRVVVVALSWVV
jgi:hypothetical protein